MPIIYNLIINFAPIFFGLLIFYILKNTNIGSKKFVLSEDILLPETNDIFCENDLKSLFIAYSKDELITSGFLPGRYVDKEAFEKLGILPFWKLNYLISKHTKNKTISLFIDHDALEKLLCSYNPYSGILSAYYTFGNLGLINYV